MDISIFVFFCSVIQYLGLKGLLHMKVHKDNTVTLRQGDSCYTMVKKWAAGFKKLRDHHFDIYKDIIAAEAQETETKTNKLSSLGHIQVLKFP